MDSERDSALYHLSGHFFSDSLNQVCSTAVKLGGVYIGGSNLLVLDSSSCPHYQLSYDSAFRDYSSYFGGSITIGINGGSGYTSTNINMYSPLQINISSNTGTASTNEFGNFNVVDKDQGYTLTWNADNNNQFEKVGIVMLYIGAASHIEDDGLDSEDFIVKEIETDDDGSYSISTKDLTDFPLNSYIEIRVGRVSHQKLTSNGRSIAINCLTIDGQDFILK